MKTTELCHTRTSVAWIGKLLNVCAFTVLISFSALLKLPLPFTPVPVTLQNLVVFLAGAFLGPVLGVACVGLYIAMGILGVPLFAGTGAGVLYLFGPTGGYLLGFFAAAWLIGHVTSRLKTEKVNITVLYITMLCGTAVIYLSGGIWLRMGYGWNLEKILFLGISPFFIPDVIKAFIAAVIYKNLRYYRRAR